MQEVDEIGSLYTELFSESIGVLHVDAADGGEECVLFGIFDGPDNYSEVAAVKDELVRRRVVEQQLRNLRQRTEEMKVQMRQREQAIARLEEAGYDGEEIPL